WTSSPTSAGSPSSLAPTRSRSSAPSSNPSLLLARDHAAREPALDLAQATGLRCGRVRPLAWRSRPRSWAQFLEGALVLTTLPEAVEAFVGDGDTVALEGFTHLIPHAAGHELIRQERRDLTLVRMTPDVVYDQLIGAGCARKLVFSWGGNPGVGS